jgi:hypothetical protein
MEPNLYFILWALVDSPATMQSVLQTALNESARASASVTRGTPQEHWVIQDCNARGESKGSKCAAECQRQGQAQQEVASINHDGAPLKMNVKGKSVCLV